MLGDKAPLHPAPRVQSGGVHTSAVESDASRGVRKLKKDDSEISPLPPNDVSALIASGTRPVNDSEPPSVEQVASGDQLSAPRAPLVAGLVPRADISVWRPPGARMLRELKFQAHLPLSWWRVAHQGGCRVR